MKKLETQYVNNTKNQTEFRKVCFNLPLDISLDDITVDRLEQDDSQGDEREAFI